MYSIHRERRRGREGSLTGEQEQEGLLQTFVYAIADMEVVYGIEPLGGSYR
jgi:hypothetical protein